MQNTHRSAHWRRVGFTGADPSWSRWSEQHFGTEVCVEKHLRQYNSIVTKSFARSAGKRFSFFFLPSKQSSIKRPIYGKQRLSGDSIACTKCLQNIRASVSLPLTDWPAVHWITKKPSAKRLRPSQTQALQSLKCMSKCKILLILISGNHISFTVQIKLSVYINFALTK